LTSDPVTMSKADEAFTQARRRVFIQRIVNFFTGHHEEALLSFDQVRDRLKIRGQRYIGTQTIPLDKIVGTTGRYQEFNRAFLPTQEFIRERWKQVYFMANSSSGFPPIEVYKIGDVYFVRDGHHRVSVLKELGVTIFEAVVTELETPISLSPDIDEEELALKEEYAAFLEETELDQSRPEQNIEFTLPGQYRKLFEHIAVHRYFVGASEHREVQYGEAAALWYDEVYRPVVDLIREEKILEQFPNRTEADLYLWIVEHRRYLSERYEQEVPLEEAAAEFSREFATGPGRKQLDAEVKRAKRIRLGKGEPTKKIAVFGSGSMAADHPEAAQAERLGQLLAEAGYTVICGGYSGAMEAASRGARRAGGEVIGVTMELFAHVKPNPWLTKEKRVKNFFPRLKQLTTADGFVVLRGGVGTLTEMTLTWSLLQTGQIPPKPLILVGDGWQRLFDAFRAETFVTEGDLALVTVVHSVEDVLAVLREALSPNP
jgi:uncharacterized protein (TIGR00730 family)